MSKRGDWTPLPIMYILFIIRTKALILAKNLRTSKKNKASLAVTHEVRPFYKFDIKNFKILSYESP